MLHGRSTRRAGLVGFRSRKSPSAPTRRVWRSVATGSRGLDPLVVHTSSVGYYLCTSGVHFDEIADPSVPRSPSVKPALASLCNPPLLT